VRQDPVLSEVKLIAEPWDIGPNGYQLGKFPPGWAEWNGLYRDGMRAFWKGDDGAIADTGCGLLGWADLFDHGGRRPWASVNFITAHDGFTLKDLVSYNEKHNEANLEDNRDGHDDNRSWNCGVEGPTDDPEVLALRDRQRRNLVATLLVSQGTPMILMGDERGRSLGGNNNGYCQDNDLSWIDWGDLPRRDRSFLEFVQGMIRIRKRLPALRETHFLHGNGVADTGILDIVWLRPDAVHMLPEDWENPQSKSVGLLLCAVDRRRVLIFLNAHHESVTFHFPTVDTAPGWRMEVDTVEGIVAPGDVDYGAGTSFDLPARSLYLFTGQAP
jgi:glycogen operon protein